MGEVEVTTPHGTDDSGAPIETVTTTATRLTDWRTIIAMILIGVALWKLMTDGK